jgi:DNA (cytosine-5)-methyltransferase 1
MKYGSICSGVAPQTKAWKALGLDCAWFSEIEPFPSAVLKHHFPEIPNLGDFTQIGSKHGSIDLLVGGTPCQSFSVAGKRAGLDDPRGNLTIEFARLAQRLRPRWLVWENVPGVLSIDGGRTFGAFLGLLGELGYGFAYRVLDAQYFGVAQRRRRVFVVGCIGNWRAAAAVLFERESLSGNPAPSREKGQGTTFATAPSLTASGRGVERTGESRGQYPVVAIGLDEEQNAVVDGFGCLKSRERGGGFEGCVGVPETARCLSTKNERIDAETETFIPTFSIQSVNMVRERKQKGIGISDEEVMYTVTGRDQHAVAFAENQRGELRTSEIAPQLSCAGGKPGSGYPAVAFQQNASAEVRTGDVAYTLNQNFNASGRNAGMVQQSMAVRRLTPRECERLQGMSDDYTLIPWRGKMAPDGPRYKAIGNSWAVPVLNWIGRRIVEASNQVS